MFTNKTYASVLTLAAVMAVATVSADAAIIGFEAESGTLGTEFDPALADAGASAGFYITTETDNGGTEPGSDAFTVSYSLNVPAGTYDVYIRARIGNNNPNDDSFYYAASFGDADPTVSGDWVLNNGLSGKGIPVGTTGPFGWSSALGSPTTVTSPGGTVQWEIGAREDGFDIDAFALVTAGQSVTDSELDAALVPQVVPTPAALPAGLALLGLAAMRRRRS